MVYVFGYIWVCCFLVTLLIQWLYLAPLADFGAPFKAQDDNLAVGIEIAWL